MQITFAQKRAIDHYYRELVAYHEKHVTHETAVRSAFQNLLASFAQSANWVLIPEQTLANGKRPDDALRDSFNLLRGYWEAKDTRDDLDTEWSKTAERSSKALRERLHGAENAATRFTCAENRARCLK